MYNCTVCSNLVKTIINTVLKGNEQTLIPTVLTLYVFKNFFLQSAVTSSLPSKKLRPVAHEKNKTKDSSSADSKL